MLMATVPLLAAGHKFSLKNFPSSAKVEKPRLPGPLTGGPGKLRVRSNGRL